MHTHTHKYKNTQTTKTKSMKSVLLNSQMTNIWEKKLIFLSQMSLVLFVSTYPSPCWELFSGLNFSSLSHSTYYSVINLNVKYHLL